VSYRNRFVDDPNDLNALSETMDLEAIRGTLDELFLLARRYRRSEKFRELLKFVASFRRYSAFNAMLVHIQMPGARYVLPAKRWIKEYGRRPVADAQPLVMLQPMSPIMFGFDVAQTEGRALPDDFDNPFKTRGRLEQGEFDMTIDNAKRDGVRVNSKSLGSNLGGYVRNAASPYHCVGIGLVGSAHVKMWVDNKEIPVIADVILNANLPAETNYATLTHELGHLYCGHVGTPKPKWWPDRRTLDRNTREFEAESVSYLVCRRAGIDTPAAEYMNGYLTNNEEVPRISLEVVFKAAQRVEAMRLKKLKPRGTDREAGEG
jgi:hypothetical protein